MSTSLTLFVALLAGTVSWSLAEWGFHNFVGHKLRGRTSGSREHLRHHAEREYFAPASWKAKQAVLFAALTAPIAALLVGPVAGVAWTTGFYAAYLGYELVHRRLHTHAPPNRYGRFLRLHHFGHHFRHPNQNHGVTSALWDVVFRTYAPVQLPLRVPRKLAMTWLLDEAGELREEFEGDYLLVGRRVDTARREPAAL